MSLPEFLLPSPVCCGPHPTNHVVLCFFPCLFFFSALRASLGKRRLRLGSRWGENSKTTDRITQDTARVQSSKIERVKVKFGSSAPCEPNGKTGCSRRLTQHQSTTRPDRLSNGDNPPNSG